MIIAFLWYSFYVSTHTRMHARTDTHTHARTHARTHTLTHTRARAERTAGIRALQFILRRHPGWYGCLSSPACYSPFKDRTLNKTDLFSDQNSVVQWHGYWVHSHLFASSKPQPACSLILSLKWQSHSVLQLWKQGIDTLPKGRLLFVNLD